MDEVTRKQWTREGAKIFIRKKGAKTFFKTKNTGLENILNMKSFSTAKRVLDASKMVNLLAYSLVKSTLNNVLESRMRQGSLRNLCWRRCSEMKISSPW